MERDGEAERLHDGVTDWDPLWLAVGIDVKLAEPLSVAVWETEGVSDGVAELALSVPEGVGPEMVALRVGVMTLETVVKVAV